MSTNRESFSSKKGEVAQKEIALEQPDAITTALEATGGRPDPFGRGHVKLYLFCMIIYFCSTMNGKLTSLSLFIC